MNISTGAPRLVEKPRPQNKKQSSPKRRRTSLLEYPLMLQQVCRTCLALLTTNHLSFLFLALIAPDDYEHIYEAKSSEKKCNAKEPEKEIPDDAPTVLKEIVQKDRSAKQRSISGQDNANDANEPVEPAEPAEPYAKDEEASGCCCRII